MSSQVLKGFKPSHILLVMRKNHSADTCMCWMCRSRCYE